MLRRIYVMALSFILLAKWDWRISRQAYQTWQYALADNTNCSSPMLSLEQCRSLVRLFNKMVRHHYRPMNCLRRSLALRDLLSYYKTPCSIRVGVRMSPHKTLEAHAWVVVNDTIINDSEAVVGTYKEIAASGDLFNPQLLK
jgi:hypothetical protein